MSVWNPSAEGTIPFDVDGKKVETWYRVFGNLENRAGTPLVVLHGGPGLCHDYLLPISDLSSSRPVIFYDQLGNSRSTHLPDEGASFWTIDLFIDELVNLLNHFDINNCFDLIGHSWGGVLALEFELRRKPTGLRHIVLTNTFAKMAMWNESNAQLLKTFPESFQKAFGVGMKNLSISGSAMRDFRKVYGCRIDPFPPEYSYTLNQLFSISSDGTVPMIMFGPGGDLKDWDVINRLHNIHLPVLVLNGRYDTSQDWVNVPFFQNLPRVKWVTFEKSSHSPMFEERERYMEILGHFLDIEVA